jgi:hypothetical protein
MKRSTPNMANTPTATLAPMPAATAPDIFDSGLGFDSRELGIAVPIGFDMDVEEGVGVTDTVIFCSGRVG